MTTEDLNEYVYAKIIHDLARDFRKKRMDQMHEDGVDIGLIVKDPLTHEDLCAAVSLLEERRNESLAILKELRPETC